jgi:GntR family transcriptional repressor for pyruvate dehydrogenase complex
MVGEHVTSSARPQKVAMLVAQRIIRDVGRRGLQPGDLLPPERTMLEEYDIGRGTLREALRLLEFQGVIALKPGPKGGPVLLVPDPSHLGSTLMLLMHLKQAPYRTIVEVRVALEPVTSSLAATRMTDDELRALEQTIEDMARDLGDDETFFDANKRFHDLIAWGSGNALFGYIVDSLVGVLDGTVIGIDYPAHRRKAILTAHEEIYAVMVERDADAAAERMREHIDAYVRFAERKYPQVLGQAIRWDLLLK